MSTAAITSSLLTPLDGSAIARRNAIVYRCLTPEPAQALLFSNGHVGGSVHTPEDSLYILISRSDLWNENAAMGAIAAVRLRSTPGRFTQVHRVQQIGDLHEATIRITLWPEATTTEPIHLQLTSPSSPGAHDLLVLDIDDPTRSPWMVTIENWHAGDELCADTRACLIGTTHVNRSSVFHERAAQVKVDPAAIGVTDPLLGRAWGLFVCAVNCREVTTTWVETHASLSLPAREHHRILLAAPCCPPCEGDALQRVNQTGRSLLQMSNQAIDTHLAQHRAHWKAFWNRSYIALESGSGDAEYEERLWYTSLFTIAAASGGAYPARFNGGSYLLDRDARSWDSGYWFQNMRELYWPLFAAGHADLASSFFQMYFDAREYVRAQTRSIFGIDAPAFRETQLFWGHSPDTDLLSQRTNHGVHHNFSSLFEICLLMDWYVRTTHDVNFLQNKLYPFVADIFQFVLAYVKKEGNTYHWTPANALEVWPDAKDPAPDIAGMHYLLPRLIQWGRQFGASDEQLARWQDLLDHLPALPVGRWTRTRRFEEGIHTLEWHVDTEMRDDGVFLPAADKQPATAQAPRRNMENAEFYPVFPWGLVHMDSDAVTRRRFELTWHHRTWPHINNGWAQDVPQLARMGWSELAAQRSREHASFAQRFPNGCFISPAAPRFHGLLTDTPYLDSAGVHAMGLSEMLLQSHDGIIRIAPAVTCEWTGRFRLHALDGVIVEGAFVQGKPIAARLNITHARRLRVRNHRTVPMHVASESNLAIDAGGLLNIPVRQGQIIQLQWSDCVAPPSPELGLSGRPQVIWPGYKIRPAQPCWPTGHWHDERHGHGQVGLEADGLFPATRPSQRAEFPSE